MINYYFLLFLLFSQSAYSFPKFVEGHIKQDISNQIYGINDQVSFDVSKDLKFPAIRWGGNHTTRYNYKINTSNHAADWFFMNILYSYEEGKSNVDLLIDEAIKNKAKLLITIPMIGWVASKREYKWSYSIKKFGPQQKVDPYNSKGDAGNGVKKDGVEILEADLNETSQPVGAKFVKDWVRHIKKRAAGKLELYFALDNEPMIWHTTHKDIRYSDKKIKQPKIDYDELWERTVLYSKAIKEVEPSAKVFGPVAWGYCAYNYSAKDGCKVGKDRLLHLNKPLLDWYLSKVCEYKKKNNIRLVDYLDIHYYPAFPFSNDDEGEKAQKFRLESLKELYDESFKSKTWVNDEIALIPDMKSRIKNNCPGTKLAVTEYRFGTAMNGELLF